MDKYTSLAKLYDSFSLDAPAKEWAEYIDALLNNNGAKRGASLLDIACGTGMITLELCKKGYRITALDNSPDMLEVAAVRFAEAGAKIQIINQDMREIKLHRKVDAAVCINDGINYITDAEEVLKMFRGVSNILNEGGVFLFDISSKYKLKTMHEKSYFEEKDEGLYIWHNEYDEKNDILTMELSLYSHLEDDLYEKSLETHKQKAYKEDFLIKTLEDAGFSEIHAYNCFALDSPKSESQRIQFAAVKKRF